MKISTQKIAFIAMMSAFCVIGRLGMLALPNVQPITVIVIWMTLELGWGYGVSISILSILISNLLISMGPWTLYQMISFSIVCLCATLLPFMEKKGSLSESKLSYLPDFCRFDGIFIRIYHLGDLGTFNAWSEFLDLLCQRTSI